MAADAILGFVTCLGTVIGFVIYLLWGYLPEETLCQFGVTYFPNKYWAISVPIYICFMWMLSWVAYIAYSLYKTNDLNSMAVLRDEYTSMEKIVYQGPHIWKTSAITSPPKDIPYDVVQKLLYPQQQ